MCLLPFVPPGQRATKTPTSHSVVSPLDWYCTDPRSAAMVAVLRAENTRRAVCHRARPRANPPRDDQHAPVAGNPMPGDRGRFQRRFFRTFFCFLAPFFLARKNALFTQASSPPIHTTTCFTSTSTTARRASRRSTTNSYPLDASHDSVVYQRLAAAGLQEAGAAVGLGRRGRGQGERGSALSHHEERCARLDVCWLIFLCVFFA